MREEGDGMTEYIIEYLPDTTSIEREEVVRCRDCWYYTDKGSGFFTCGDFDSAHAEVEPDGFCKWASRRDV